MTWWCRLFHAKWWYLGHGSTDSARVVCARCKAVMFFQFRKPYALRAIEVRLEKP